jgi:hypothetical protein
MRGHPKGHWGKRTQEAAMHQASILMTAFVMIMAGVWFAMYELSGHEAVAQAPSHSAAE